jgi:hypothetical protein
MVGGMFFIKHHIEHPSHWGSDEKHLGATLEVLTSAQGVGLNMSESSLSVSVDFSMFTLPGLNPTCFCGTG